MKKVFLLMIFLGALTHLFSCKKKVLSLTCPPCWDKNMICLEGACDCPDGYIPTWLNRTGLGIGVAADSFPKKFCIKPDRLTFMAHIPRFVCLDTFAVRFTVDPYEFPEKTLDIPTGVWVMPVLPSEVPHLAPASSIRVVSEAGQKFTEVSIYGLEPTYGYTLRSGVCLELDNAGNEVGSTEMSFIGRVTHKDTISGYLEITGAGGTKRELYGKRLEDVKLIRTVPH
jgi:hypothetical protein